jgi:cell division protein FtsQ
MRDQKFCAGRVLGLQAERMMPRVRPPARRGFPLFGRKKNRRVRIRNPEGVELTILDRLRAATHRHWRAGLLLVLGLGAGGTAAVGHRLLTRSPHFRLRAIRFSPTVHVSTPTLEARVGMLLGANLFSLDLDQIGRDVQLEPWVKSAHARLELPATLAIDVTEREARAVVALSGLYLADASGTPFKRASTEEAAELPVVTGVDREQYLNEPEAAREQIRGALAVIEAWRNEDAERPALGEIHLDRVVGMTVYTATGGIAARLGHLTFTLREGGPLGAVDGSLAARLRRLDAVLAALRERGETPRLIYLDNRARPDRVTVKLARGGDGTGQVSL